MKKDVLILLAAVGVLAAGAYNASIITEARLPGTEAVSETEIEEETDSVVLSEPMEEDIPEIETETADYVMYSSIWNEVQMSFYTDGRCVFEMPDYKVSEPCTWIYAEGVLSVTRSDGLVITSYMAEDAVTLKLDYPALKHNQLIGQFDAVDYKTFFEQ